MKKIFILGASGMAGHMVYYYLKSQDKYQLYTACFRNKIAENSLILDIYNTEELKTALKHINPDYVINCIGVLVHGSKQSPENAIYVNAYFPQLLAKLISESTSAGRLIHISTDCVFSGKKGFYTDTDVKDAVDVYGMTKNLGEIIDDKNLTIRTSIIGPEIKENGEGLFHWIFSQRGKNSINGYEKSIWGGVTTLQLAKAIEQCIDFQVTGLYQLSNNEKISKYALAQLIIKQFELNIKVHKVDGIVSDKSIISSARNNVNISVPAYKVMIEELYKNMHTNKELYHFYLG